MIDQQSFQLLVFVMNGLFGLFMLFLGIFLNKVNRTLENIQGQFKSLNDKVLEHYATRNELELVRKYIRETGHDLRDDMGWHTACLYLIAQKLEMMQDIPRKPGRGD